MSRPAGGWALHVSASAAPGSAPLPPDAVRVAPTGADGPPPAWRGCQDDPSVPPGDRGRTPVARQAHSAAGISDAPRLRPNRPDRETRPAEFRGGEVPAYPGAVPQVTEPVPARRYGAHHAPGQRLLHVASLLAPGR